MGELKAISKENSDNSNHSGNFFGAFVRKPVKRAGSNSVRSPESKPLSASSIRLSKERLANDWIKVGTVAGAFGVRGWLKIYPYAQLGKSGGALLHARDWQLTKDGQTQHFAVRQAKLHGGNQVVAQLAGCADRDAAEALKGWCISIGRADFPALQAEEYYWVDLIGLDVITQTGMALGQVVGLLENGAHAVLRIVENKQGSEQNSQSDKGKSQFRSEERLIPFVAAHVSDVDLEKRQIIVNWDGEI